MNSLTNMYYFHFTALFLGFLTTEGVTIGAHRLYTHRSFKAKPALRAVLLIMQTIAGQVSNYKLPSFFYIGTGYCSLNSNQ